MRKFDWDNFDDSIQIKRMIKKNMESNDLFRLIDKNATEEEIREIVQFLEPFNEIRKTTGLSTLSEIQKLSIRVIITTKKEDSLYDQCCSEYRVKLIEQVEKKIREEIPTNGFVIMINIYKNSISTSIAKDPRFKGFKFEWIEGDKLKISL